MLCKTAHRDRPVTTNTTDIKRHITLRQLEALVPYARNARTHSPEQLAKLKARILVMFRWLIARGGPTPSARHTSSPTTGLPDVWPY